MARWLGGALPEAAHVLMFMPLKRGGIGFQSAAARADAAFLASWETAAARLAADAGLPSVEVFRATYPGLAAPVAAAESFLWSRRAPVVARRYASGGKRAAEAAHAASGRGGCPSDACWALATTAGHCGLGRFAL